MFSEQFFDLLLNFGDNWKVERVYVNIVTDQVDVFIDYIGKDAEYPETFDKYSIYDHAPLRRWRDLDTMQFKTYITSSVPRVKDSSGKVKTINTPWADNYERHTYLFERLAIDILQGTKNQTQTAKLLCCSFNVINRIIHGSVKRGLARRPVDLCFEHLSIDEKSFKKGHKYVTVLSDPVSGVVINVSEDRDYKSCKALIESAIKQEYRDKVKTISMDMWKPFMNVAKDKLPNADVLHDRFHLVKYLNDAVDKVRRREVKKHEELKKTRYIFLKNLRTKQKSRGFNLNPYRNPIMR